MRPATPTFHTASVTFTALLIITASTCGGSDGGATPEADSVEVAADIDSDTDTDTDVEVDADAETDAEQADDSADDADAPALESGAGGGTVTVGDQVCTLSADVCFASDGSLFTEGPATNPGEFGDAWVSISGDTVEDYDSDGEPDISADVTVKHGPIENRGEGNDDSPDFSANRIVFSSQPEEDRNEGGFDFSIDGSTITGSGQIYDNNGIALAFGETQAFSFEASCS